MSSVTRFITLRGTTAQRQSVTFLDGELVWDSTEKAMYVGDDVTAGGVPISTLSVEAIQDIIAALFIDSATISFNYDDNAGTFTGDVVISDNGNDADDILSAQEVNTRINTAISNLIDASPAALDTLNELAEALGDDANYAATIATQQAAQDTALAQEITDRTTTDTSLQAQINANDNDIVNNANGLAQEIIDRAAVDTTLQNQISTNDTDIAALVTTNTNQQAAITANQTSINNEVTNRVNADTAIQTQIDSNDTDISNLQAADTALQNQITSNDADILALQNSNTSDAAALAQEILDRQAADTALQNLVNVNTTNIATNANGLASEITNRTSADTTLQNQINTNDTDIANIQTNLNSYDLSTTVDTKITTAINNLISGAGIDLDTLSELADAINNDANFAATIAAQQATQNTNISNNAAAVTAEQFARLAADTVLQNQINTNDTDIANEILARIAADTALQTQVTANANGLAQEVIDRAAGDTVLQNQITSNDTDITNLQNDKADKSVVLTAGDGLSGGGDLSANRTFNVNVQNTVVLDSDSIQLTNDETNAGNRKFYGTSTTGVKGYQDLDTAIARYLDKSAFEDDTFYVNTVNDFTTDPDAIAVSQDITPIHTATYLVEVDFIYSCDIGTSNGEVELLIDGVFRKRHEEEMKDSGGTDGASGTDHRITGTFSTLVTATANTPFNIELRHRPEENGVESTIKSSTVKVQRWLQA